MEQTKYLSMLSDDIIKRTARKFCDYAYIFFGEENPIRRPKITLTRNEDNFVMTIKYPGVNRVATIVLTDYAIYVCREAKKIEFGVFDSYFYTKAMTHFCGKEYKQDLEKNEQEIYKTLGLTNYLQNVTDEEYLKFFKKNSKSFGVKFDTIKLSHVKNTDKIYIQWLERDNPSLQRAYQTSYYTLHHYRNDYGNCDKYESGCYMPIDTFNFLYKKFGEQYFEDYKKHSNYVYEQGKKVLKLAYEQNIECIKENVKDKKELTKELLKLELECESAFRNNLFMDKYFADRMTDEKMNVYFDNDMSSEQKDRFLERTNFNEEYNKEKEEMFGKGKTEQIEDTL